MDDLHGVVLGEEPPEALSLSVEEGDVASKAVPPAEGRPSEPEDAPVALEGHLHGLIEEPAFLTILLGGEKGPGATLVTQIERIKEKAVITGREGRRLWRAPRDVGDGGLLVEGRPRRVHGDPSGRQRLVGRRGRSPEPCMNRPVTDGAAVAGNRVHGSRVEPSIRLDSTFHGTGAEPLFKRQVARLVKIRGKVVPRGEADKVAHQPEKGLDETLEVSGILTPEVGFGEELVTELGEVRIPRAVNAHDSFQDVAKGAEIAVRGEDSIELPPPKVGDDNCGDRARGDRAHEVRIGGLRTVGGQR